MSRRAYDVLRSYVGREWERLSELDEANARNELRRAMDAHQPKTATPTASTPPPEEMSLEDRKKMARKILGVADDAPFADIRKAFERLNKRSDPVNFPEGSTEAEKAIVIRQRVQWAFEQLTEDMNPSEQRFRSLEI